MIIRAAVTRSDLKKYIAKTVCNYFLATPTSTTTDAMARKFFQILCNYLKTNSAKICESD